MMTSSDLCGDNSNSTLSCLRYPAVVAVETAESRCSPIAVATGHFLPEEAKTSI